MEVGDHLTIITDEKPSTLGDGSSGHIVRDDRNDRGLYRANDLCEILGMSRLRDRENNEH